MQGEVYQSEKNGVELSAILVVLHYVIVVISLPFCNCWDARVYIFFGESGVGIL